MKITRKKLERIIKEELMEMFNHSSLASPMPSGTPSRPTDDPKLIVRDIIMAMRRLEDPDAVTEENIETIQSLLDRLKATAVGTERRGDSARIPDRWSAIERGIAPE